MNISNVINNDFIDNKLKLRNYLSFDKYKNCQCPPKHTINESLAGSSVRQLVFIPVFHFTLGGVDAHLDQQKHIIITR